MQKVEVSQKITRRTKEKTAYVEKTHARSNTLYKRKSTLFSKGLKLHTMTKAEVLIIIDQQNGKRFVCGSEGLLDVYNKGEIRPTKTDKKYDGKENMSPMDIDLTGIEPLEDTPDRIEIDHGLSNVLGHEKKNDADYSSRRQLFLRRSHANVPMPVQQLLLNRPVPQLDARERSEVPPIQRQSKITFVCDGNVQSNL